MKKNTFTISLIIIGLITLCFSYVVNADDTGYISPDNDGANYDEYQAPENAYTQSDTYARSGLADRYDEQDWHEFDFDLPTGCPVIDGILVEVDCYGAVSGINYDVKLTWDGTNYTTAKNTGNIPTSDTDTYIQLGSASDLWGHSWTYDELKSTIDGGYFSVLFHHLGSAGFGWIDHVRIKVYYTSVQPNMPNWIQTYNDASSCMGVDFIINKGTGADSTLVKWSADSYPTFSTGVELYNNSGSSFTAYFSLWDKDYYITAWSWNDTYCLYSQDYDNYYHSPCSNNITLYENIVNITGTHDSQYLNDTGWKVWANYSNCINIIESLSNTTGGYEVKFNGTCNNVYNNYSTLIFLYENIVNATGTLEVIYKETTFGFYQVWANYTGNESEGVPCGMYYYNFSDENITINITVNCCNLPENTTSYNINSDNWLNLAGTLLFDNAQIFLFILISCWLYFVSKYYELGLKILSLIQLAFAIPLSIAIAVISMDFPFGFVIVFIIPIISIYLAYEGFVYGKN